MQIGKGSRFVCCPLWLNLGNFLKKGFTIILTREFHVNSLSKAKYLTNFRVLFFLGFVCVFILVSI